MKSSILYITFTLLAIGTLMSCGDDAPTNNNDPKDSTSVPVDYSFKMTVNDVPWEADTAILQEPVLPNGFAKEIVAWKKPEGQAEKITILLTSTDPGTYPITSDLSTVSVNFIADNNPPGAFDPDPTPGTEGSLVIVESTSEYITGTFSFKGASTFNSKTYEGKTGTFKVRVAK
ncbi:MAG: hypothetical protein KDD67_09125 [Ignavibacteriae bacterium]|nr:hypothetical protein [Ignavibacteriota bacterium]MCB9216496.1 hypothetical protein [Ignavibacteria bacterium]